MHHKSELDIHQHREVLIQILREVIHAPAPLTDAQFSRLMRRYPNREGGHYRRSELVAAFRTFAGSDGLPPYDDEIVLERLRLKPVRTSSGVTPVTVLTKPFPCPGTCIFCPNDVRMPKSYLSDEPGAQRAEQNAFDPYLQTYTRLQAYRNNGHPTDKIEVIVLGGTWSFYPESYQIWFIRRIFDAMHDFGKGIDRREAVLEALREASQLHPDLNTVNVQVHGLDIHQTYNAVVQTIYKDEMRRSRELVEEIAVGQRDRSPIDEYATWDELEAAHRENETAACRPRSHQRGRSAAYSPAGLHQSPDRIPEFERRSAAEK
jgi:elongator complex protein 3